MGDVGAVATLLEKVFGFVVDPDGLAKMKRDHKISLIMVAYEIALDKNDTDAIDALLAELRGMQ